MLVWTFIRQAFLKWTAYRTAFWVDVFSRVLQIYVMYAVWSLLYRQKPEVFGNLSFAGVFGYVVMGIVMGSILTLDEGPHIRIAERVRTGMIAVELMKPVSFIRLAAFESFGDLMIRIAIYAAVPYLFALAVFRIPTPENGQQACLFLVSLALSAGIQFFVHFLFGLIAFYTLDLTGFQFAYWALVRFFSGQWIPLSLYPDVLRPFLYALPFQAMFATPQSIYVGQLRGWDAGWALTVQSVWVVILGAATWGAWRIVQRHIVIQGG
ncbi:MAG: ABC-2 family transporter protein [Alicyclobacillaceae bacterium]|nr:ABC-2 family transporter protein [Alicyclobacillaceae bacterium]